MKSEAFHPKSPYLIGKRKRLRHIRHRGVECRIETNELRNIRQTTFKRLDRGKCCRQMQRRILDRPPELAKNLRRNALVIAYSRASMHNPVSNAFGLRCAAAAQRFKRVLECGLLGPQSNSFLAFLSAFRALEPEARMLAADFLRFSFAEE